MIKFSVTTVEAGWALSAISDGARELLLSVSYTPADALRDFVDAVQSLHTIVTARCCWYQEPGELHWKLVRTASNLDVEILSLAHVKFPGKHGEEGISVFTAQTDFLDFAKQVAYSMDALRAKLGTDGYERAWRHPFPTESCEKLLRAIQAESGTSDRTA